MTRSRKGVMKFTWCSLIVVIFILFSYESAYAYVDPGSGGLLYQLMVVFLALVASYFSFLGNWLKRLIKRGTTNHSDEED